MTDSPPTAERTIKIQGNAMFHERKTANLRRIPMPDQDSEIIKHC